MRNKESADMAWNRTWDHPLAYKSGYLGKGGGGVSPLMTYTLYGEAPPERIGVSLVVVCKKPGKSVISVCEEAHKCNRCISWLCKSKSIENVLVQIVIYSYFKENASTTVKWIQRCQLGM